MAMTTRAERALNAEFARNVVNSYMPEHEEEWLNPDEIDGGDDE